VRFDELDGLIREQVERDRLPGLAIALVKDGELIWSRGYGCADLERDAPVSPSTVFQIQSVTKTVVATALMQRVERGDINLDAPVNEYLAPLRVENQWESETPVTLRGLLTHSAGLPVSTVGGPGSPDHPVSLEEYIQALAKAERLPGDRVVYANIGFTIGGWLLGKLAGKRYDEALRECVLEPLSMRSTALPDRLGNGTSKAVGYFLSVVDGAHHQGDDRWPTDPADPAGGLCSTVEDLARYLIAHIERDERLLRRETFEAMHALQFEVGSSGDGMALGFRVSSRDGRILISHGGDGFGFSDFIGAFPEERAGVALLINLGRAHEARTMIAAAALRSLAGDAVRRPLSGKAAPADARQFEGHYQASFWGIEADVSTDEDNDLSLGVNTGLTVQQPLVSQLESIGGAQFRAHGGFFDGWELTFEREDDGTLTFSGGIYPWYFTRTGDVIAESSVTADDTADLHGTWTGTMSSPYGSVPTTINVTASGAATIDAMSAHGERLRSFHAENGRVDGDFAVEVPNIGKFDVFLRLVASEGRLTGASYARGPFGEVGMPTTLVRG
jgi:CubicO group peptidase (beta-lactamase class C family)